MVRTLIAHQLRYDPRPYLVEGMRVRVTHGPLAGVEGILVLKKSAARLIIQTDNHIEGSSVERYSQVA